MSPKCDGRPAVAAQMSHRKPRIVRHLYILQHRQDRLLCNLQLGAVMEGSVHLKLYFKPILRMKSLCSYLLDFALCSVHIQI